MQLDPVARYVRYYRFLLSFRRLGVRFCLFALCRLVPGVWPKQEQEVLLKTRWAAFFSNTDRIWRDYRRCSIYSDIVAQSVEFADLRIDVDDPHGVLARPRSEGTLFLTFHHHFSLHFPSVLGQLGVKINAMTGDPVNSPLRVLLEHYPDYFAKFERSFAGGRFFFQNPLAPNFSEMRRVLQDLGAGISLVSGHDFESPFPDSEKVHIQTQFFTVNAPVGVVPYCAKKRVPVVFGYLTMQDHRGFVLHLRPYDAGSYTEGALGIFEFYRACLVTALASNPELFDLWHVQA